LTTGPEESGRDPEGDPGWVRASRYMGFGFEFAAIIVAGVIGGSYLDERLGTAPWLTLLITLAAMVGALQRLLSGLKKNSSRRST
jgi:F0F1-type ATP synthase assembly protein I